MRKNQFAGIDFDTLRLEGSLFTADIVHNILSGNASKQSAKDYDIPPGLTISDEAGRGFRIASACWAGRKDGQMGLDKFAWDFFHNCLGYTKEDYAAVVNTNRDDAHWEIKAAVSRDVYTIRLLRPSASLGRPAFVEFNLETILNENRFPDFKMLYLFFHASRSRRTAGQCIWDVWKKEGEDIGVRVRDKLRDGVTEALTALGQGFLAFDDAGNESLRQKLENGDLSSAEYFTELLRLIYRFLFLITIEERGLLFEHDPSGAADSAQRQELQAKQEIYHSGYSMRRLRDRALTFQASGAYSDIWAGLKILWKALARGEARLDLPSLGGLFAPLMCPNLDRCKISNAAILAAMRRLRWTYEGSRLMLIDYKNLDVEELGSVYESLLELEPVLNVPRGEFSFAGKGGVRKTTGSYYTDESLVVSLIKSNLDPLIAEKLEGGSLPPAPAPRSGRYVHACGASTSPSAWSSAPPSPKGAAAPLKSPLQPEKILLSITVIDPSCGSGHFLLAAARRLAEHLAQLRHGEITDANYRAALRDIIASNIYGVDLNPLAVELTRMALWLEGYERGKPLSFLDHHIRCGNSLVGVMDFDVLAKGIPDDAYKVLSGDDSEAARKIKKQNKEEIEDLKRGQGNLFAEPFEKTEARLTAFHWRLENLTNDSLEDVEQKRRLFEDLLASPEYRQTKNACDLYTAAFYAEKQKGAPVPTTADINRAAAGQAESLLSKGVNALAAEIAAGNRFFHWRLEFPEVFTKGGFDCVLGNPPWERLKLQEKEYFEFRVPEIAEAQNKAARDRMIKALKTGNEYEKKLHADFIKACRNADAASAFAHTGKDAGGRFPLTGTGDVNTYALFAETIIQILSPIGRAGFIVPSGIATDSTTQYIFGFMITNARLQSFYEFENEGFFPDAGQGHMVRFALTSIVGQKFSITETAFLFQGKDLKDLKNSDRVFSLSPQDIVQVNPNTKTCPVFRSRMDAETTKAIYSRVPILVHESRDGITNPWNVSFMCMFHMSNDSSQFRTKKQLIEKGYQASKVNYIHGNNIFIPLYESKMMNLYNHRFGDFNDANGTHAHILPDISKKRFANSEYLVEPFYWINENDVKKRMAEMDWQHKWLLGFRNVTDSRASARTVIFSIIPYSGVGNSINLIFPRNVEKIEYYAAFIGNMSSIILDYVARMKVGGLNLNHFILKQLPVLPPQAYSGDDIAFIVSRVLELVYTAEDLRGFAEDLWQGADESLRRLFVKQWEENQTVKNTASPGGAHSPPSVSSSPLPLPPFVFDPAHRSILRAELDARYARLYGLTRDELRYILDPSDIMGADYPSETFRVLKEKETAEFGEYRTRRLTLEAWDREET
jgi:hypothetical protein